jgi:hypothetical protein
MMADVEMGALALSSLFAPPLVPAPNGMTHDGTAGWEKLCRECNLPREVAGAYAKVGISSLYAWQVECLQSSHVLTDARPNLVYCAPTGGGKTVVSELVILKTILARGRKALFVLPFVSLVLEKLKYWQKLLHFLNRGRQKGNKLKVAGIYGDQSISAANKCHVVICTIEKANAILNSFVLSKRIDCVGCMVLDEMHTLGEAFNGYQLEILISKVRRGLGRPPFFGPVPPSSLHTHHARTHAAPPPGALPREMRDRVLAAGVPRQPATAPRSAPAPAPAPAAR